jgi:hypothetical protein
MTAGCGLRKRARLSSTESPLPLTPHPSSDKRYRCLWAVTCLPAGPSSPSGSEHSQLPHFLFNLPASPFIDL